MAEQVDPNMIEDADATSSEDLDEHDSPLDRMRDLPVGTNDPNIVGDVGPTDIPPGTDPPN